MAKEVLGSCLASDLQAVRLSCTKGEHVGDGHKDEDNDEKVVMRRTRRQMMAVKVVMRRTRRQMTTVKLLPGKMLRNPCLVWRVRTR